MYEYSGVQRTGSSAGASEEGSGEKIALLMAPLLRLGMIEVGVPYSVKALLAAKGGGRAYGPGHIAGGNSQRGIDEEQADICRACGKRLAEVGLQLQK
jgi:NAD(P)H dehydrogenase (quinone)